VFEKLTIKEYMERENVSRTTVENRIKSGDLEAVKEGRFKFVKVYKVCKPNVNPTVQTPLQTNVNPTVQTSTINEEYIQELKAQIKAQKKELKRTKKELKNITQQLLEEKDINKKEKDESIKILKQYIGEVKLLADISSKNDLIDTEELTKKDKKKSKKKNKKKKY